MTGAALSSSDAASPLENRSRSRFWSWAIGTAAILVIGGTNNTYPLPRGLAEAIAAILLGAVIASRRTVFHGWRTHDRLVAAVPLVALLQLVPLPPNIWAMLPGREKIVALSLAVDGELGWRPVTLNIEATWRSLLFFLVPATFYVAVRTGSPERIRAIFSGVAIAFATAVGMAVLQIAGIEWAYPFADGRADRAYAIGFFTNHNHQATFLLIGFVMVCGLLSFYSLERMSPWRAKGSALMVGWREFVLGIVATVAALLVYYAASRAGVVLLAISLPLVLIAWFAPLLPDRKRLIAMVMIGALAVGSALSLLPFLSDGPLAAIADRAALSSDRRFEIWSQALETALRVMPMGSGFGTFRESYEMFEPLDIVGQLYVNHAHNDYLQVAIEGGLPGILLIAFFGWQWVRGTCAAWAAPSGRAALLARLGSTALFIVFLHSSIDYPARTIAVAGLCGIAFALLARNEPGTRPHLASSKAGV